MPTEQQKFSPLYREKFVNANVGLIEIKADDTLYIMFSIDLNAISYKKKQIIINKFGT